MTECESNEKAKLVAVRMRETEHQRWYPSVKDGGCKQERMFKCDISSLPSVNLIFS
jgi:hypothetical protein